MPLFIWKGVDEEGLMHNGTAWAASVPELERGLLQKSIAVVQSRVAFVWPVSRSQKRQFFFQVAELLEAHIPLYQSLLIVAANHKGLMRIEVEDIAQRISQGTSFSAALEEHAFTDTLSSALVRMGEATGALGAPLKKLVDYWSITASFVSRARAALFVPCITFVFFLILLMGMLICIIPRFEQYFCASGAKLPWITQLLVNLSNGMRTQGYLWAVFLGSGICALIFLKKHFGGILFQIPGVAGVVKHWWLVRFLQALELLLKNNIPLSDSLEICAITMRQEIISHELVLCKQLIDSGRPLSNALQLTFFASPELESYIIIGETSGELGHMIGFAARTYQQRMFSKLQRCVILINPLLLLVLGGCIAGLIVALYMPLLLLSDTLF